VLDDTVLGVGLSISFTDDDVGAVPNLLVYHWADDHHLPAWRDAAACASDRL